jgi:CubicO group peptidase (beta-lactamase class C family)
MDRGAASVRGLEAAVRAVGERALGVEGLHVAVDGQPPVEQHWVADVRRDVFSASKTVTSMAVGIARAEGLLDLGDSVLTHLDHLASASSAGVEQITIQHLLTMSSGVIYRWEDPDSDHPDDAARDILSAPLGAAPGSCHPRLLRPRPARLPGPAAVHAAGHKQPPVVAVPARLLPRCGRAPPPYRGTRPTHPSVA